MKTVVSIMAALVLAVLLAVPVLAQDGDKNCDDFNSQAEAQQYFRDNGGSPTNNVDGLDRDNDGVACENKTDYPDSTTDLRPATGQPPATVEPANTPSVTATIPAVEETEAPETEETPTASVPDDMGGTGAGGLAAGGGIPVGGILAAFWLLSAGAFIILRRR